MLAFYQYFAELYSHTHGNKVQCVTKRNCLKNMLSTDTRFFGAKFVERSGYLYTPFSVLYFSLLFWVVLQKVLPLSHKDVAMRCNEGPNVWSSNLMPNQPIFLQNNCIVFKISLVYTDKPVRKVIPKYHCVGRIKWGYLLSANSDLIFRLLLFW